MPGISAGLADLVQERAPAFTVGRVPTGLKDLETTCDLSSCAYPSGCLPSSGPALFWIPGSRQFCQAFWIRRSRPFFLRPSGYVAPSRFSFLASGNLDPGSFPRPSGYVDPGRFPSGLLAASLHGTFGPSSGCLEARQGVLNLREVLLLDPRRGIVPSSGPAHVGVYI